MVSVEDPNAPQGVLSQGWAENLLLCATGMQVRINLAQGGPFCVTQ